MLNSIDTMFALFSPRIPLIKKHVTTVTVLPITLILVVAALFLWEINALNTVRRWEQHSEAVLSRANITYRTLIDAQNRVRGYIISGELSRLKPFYSAEDQFQHNRLQLQNLVSESGDQTGKVKEINEMANEWFRLAKEVIKNKQFGYDDIYRGNSKGAGKRLMDEIREKFDDFIEIENQIKVQRTERVNTAENEAIVIGLILLFMAGLILALFTRKTLLFLMSTYEEAIRDSESKSRELFESREWFATTLTSIGDAVIVVDRYKNVAFINPVAEKLTGWSMKDAVNRPMAEVFRIFNLKTRKPAMNPVDRVLREGKIAGLANHTVLIHKAGKEFPIEDSASPIRNSEGSIFGVVLVFRDVTDTVKAQAEIAERENRFRQLANSAPVFIWTAGPDKGCDWVNKVWLDYTGRTISQELGIGWYESVHPDDREESSKIYRTFFDARQPFEIEYRLRRADGVYRWIHDKGIPRYSPDGTFVGYIGSCIDIHEAHENKLRLESLTSDLEKALKSRDEFLSIASHELKTPLTSLKLRLDMTSKAIDLERGVTPPLPKLKRDLNLCIEQSQKLAALIEELLDVSRIQSGKLTFNFESTNLSELLTDTIAFYENQFKAAGSQVATDIDENVYANCDRFRIDQVLVNLISNTIKYGRGKPVDISLKAEDHLVKIVVKDSGIGIDKSIQHLIFNRFERATSSKVISGLGLGLYITKQIISAHQGTIEVKSDLGEGATFTVTFPQNL